MVSRWDTWAPTIQQLYQLLVTTTTDDWSIPACKDCFAFCWYLVSFMEVVTAFWVTDNNVVSTDFFQNLWACFTRKHSGIFKVAVLSSNFMVWNLLQQQEQLSNQQSTAGAFFVTSPRFNKIWWREVLTQLLQRIFASSDFCSFSSYRQ